MLRCCWGGVGDVNVRLTASRDVDDATLLLG